MASLLWRRESQSAFLLTHILTFTLTSTKNRRWQRLWILFCHWVKCDWWVSMLLLTLLTAALLKIDIDTKCRGWRPNYIPALRALKYLERLREKEMISYLFTHTVVSYGLLNLAQPKPVFRLLCSFALVAAYFCTSAGMNEWVCRMFFLISDISHLFKVYSLALYVAFNYISRSQANIKLWKKWVNWPKTKDFLCQASVFNLRSRINLHAQYSVFFSI